MPFLLVAILPALALASNGAAKELASAQACGRNGCTVLEDREVANTILSSRASVSPPPPTADFYVLSFIFDGGDPNMFLHYFVPSTGLIAGNKVVPGELMWPPVYDDALAGIREVVRDLEPFVAPKVWPTELKSPGSTSESRDWTPWLARAGVLLLALASAAFLSRRLRLRRPATV